MKKIKLSISRLVLPVSGVLIGLILIGQLSSILHPVAISMSNDSYLVEDNPDYSGTYCLSDSYYDIDKPKVIAEEKMIGWPVRQSTEFLPMTCIGDVRLSSELGKLINFSLLAFLTGLTIAVVIRAKTKNHPNK